MSLFIQHTYPSYKWGVWKMDETLDELLSMLPQQETYLEGLQRFSAEHRRLEWLSVRVLLFTLLGEERKLLTIPAGNRIWQINLHQSVFLIHVGMYR